MSDGSLEQAIGAVLQDPQQLQKIFALAQSLGLSPPEAPAAPPPPEPLKPAAAAPPAEQTPEDRGSALRAGLPPAGQRDRRPGNRLNPRKPLFKAERREKVDRAMQAARISRLAGAALRGRDQKDP